MSVSLYTMDSVYTPRILPIDLHQIHPPPVPRRLSILVLIMWASTHSGAWLVMSAYMTFVIGEDLLNGLEMAAAHAKDE